MKLNSIGAVLNQTIEYLKSTKFISTRPKKDVIKVGFIVQVPEIWDKEIDVYNEMLKRDNIDVKLIVVPPFDFEKWELSYDYYNNYFIDNFDNTIKAVDENKDVIDIETLGFDYIFYQRPYNHYLPRKLQIDTISKYSKCCYISYGYIAAKNFKYIRVLRDFFGYAYFAFYESKYIYKYAILKYPLTSLLRLRKFENLGYPSLESYFNISISESINNVLWTPRWSFSEDSVKSNFIDYKDFFVSFGKKNNNLELTLRPHPLLFDNLIKMQFMTRDEVDKYKSNFQKNLSIDENSTLIDAIKKSDVLVSDYSTLIVNYFVTEKPIIYCYSKGANYTPEFKKIINCSYVAYNQDDIEDYLNMLMSGKDPLKAKRLKCIDESFSNNIGSTTKIVNRIERDYYGRK